MRHADGGGSIASSLARSGQRVGGRRHWIDFAIVAHGNLPGRQRRRSAS
jgi:hypothetical protein